MLMLWLCCGPSKGPSRRTQFVALVVIILILFPVISVTDDLIAAQNPAEVVGCQRKDHVCSDARFALHPVPAVPHLTSALPSCRSLSVAAENSAHARLLKNTSMASIQNRPPPAA
jgi:hypothetical protein